MSKKGTVILAGLVAGIFLAGTVPAYAIPGLRAARNAMMAKKAKDKLAENPEEQTPPAGQTGSENGAGYAAGPSGQEDGEKPARRQGPVRRLLGMGEE